MKRILLFMFISCTVVGLTTAQDIIYSQDFNAEYPEGWESDGVWAWGNETEHSSQYFAFTGSDGNFMASNDDALGNGADGSGTLYSEVIDMSAADAGNYLLGFDFFFLNGDYGGADETAKVSYSTDGGSTWVDAYDAEVSADASGTMLAWNTAKVVLENVGGEMVQLRFDYRDGGGWNYGVGFDNVQIVSNNTRLDATVTNLSAARYMAVGTSAEPAMLSIENNGYETISSLGIDITVNGETITADVEDLDVAQFSSVDIPLDAVALDEPVIYEMAINVVSINGDTADENTDDNTVETSFFGVQDSPVRNTVAEEATGTWCGWCPRGAVFMEFMKEAYPDDFVGIAVHNSDPMVNSEYDNALTSTPGFLGFPSVVVDRTSVIDPQDLEEYHNANISRTSPTAVDFTYEYDQATRTITVDASVTAHTSLRNIHRLTMVIIEDNVTGSGSDWAQANYYSGGGAGTMEGYENLADPVPATDMIYEDVARDIVGGHIGEIGSIPDSEFGDVVNHTFEYTIPEDYKAEDISIAVIAVDTETGETLNGAKKHLEFVNSVTDVPTQLDAINIIPNPATDQAMLNIDLNESSDVSISLVNNLGQVIAHKTHRSVTGNQMFPINRNDLPAGTYLVKVAINDRWVTKRVSFVD